MFTDFKEFDNHEMVIAMTDEKAGLHAFVAIHNSTRGPAQGGTRMLTYESEDAAIKDALNLSRAMSYKCALANLPYGGGKAVIMIQPGSDRQKVLEAYAKMVDRLNGQFKTGTDVGLTDQDVVFMSQFTKHMMGVVEADRGDLNTSKTAARGVVVAIKTALQCLYNSDSLNDRKIAIKGVGKLGGELARLVHAEGAKVIIADSSDEACQAITAELSDITVVPASEIHKQQVDIYAPCALGSEFTDEVIGALQCRAVVGGANNQLPNPEAGDKLLQNDVLYAPDYITNAGGLMYVVDELEADGFNKDRVLQRVAGIKDTLEVVFERSAQEQIATNRVADTIAQERIKI